MSRTDSLRCPGLVLLLAVAASTGAMAGREDSLGEPLVLTGAELELLRDRSPAEIVAYRFDRGWNQVPVQVDERATVDFGQIYGGQPKGSTVLTYADPGTFTGADPDPSFDADDELVLRSGDAGSRWEGSPLPDGVRPETLQELRIVNERTGRTRYLYLFAASGAADPSAGVAPVNYRFRLLSGSYLETYDTKLGPNPENSSVRTPWYTAHFSDRWIRDGLSIQAGRSSGVDILDQEKVLFAPGVCDRTVETFAEGQGAFIVNRTGPVRALRGYVGANSGITSHQVHQLYADRERVRLVVRVHPVPGLMQFMDYAPQAEGMVYYNEANRRGFRIDGRQDPAEAVPVRWEMVTGRQGTVTIAWKIETDIPGFEALLHYSDDERPASEQCSGDGHEYGASGLRESRQLPNTDPDLDERELYYLEVERELLYGGPGTRWFVGQRHGVRFANPLRVTVER